MTYMNSYSKLSVCRICGNKKLTAILDLGEQTLTGVFPKAADQQITAGPIQLVKCTGGPEVCGLLQMAHSYDLDEMYGENYGYRSGLNASMVKHLNAKIDRALSIAKVSEPALVLDIGSNDGTSLAVYPDSFIRIGMDPTAEKFRQYYKPGIHIIADFFSAAKFKDAFPDKKAQIVTSFSMFYDLERPMDFVREISQILHSDGAWIFEQSYMPLMLERNSFDTACHEHLEYYAFKQIDFMLKRCGLKAIDVEFNDVNGGSFSVTAAHENSKYPEWNGAKNLLHAELPFDDLQPYRDFATRIDAACIELKAFVANANADGRKVAALGASTKGNVLLQYCGFTAKDLFAVAEVNPEKYGCFTPGSLIPIRSDSEVISEADFLIVLPWHFKDFFLQKYSHCKEKLIFPLPNFSFAA